MLETIVNIQPKDSGGGGGETRESVVYKLADDMLEKLPEDYVPHEVRLQMLFGWNHLYLNGIIQLITLYKQCRDMEKSSVICVKQNIRKYDIV